MEEKFLGYLDEWEAEVSARTGFTEDEKKKMTLSKETLEGLHMTGTVYLHVIHVVTYNHVYLLLLLYIGLFLIMIYPYSVFLC